MEIDDMKADSRAYKAERILRELASVPYTTRERVVLTRLAVNMILAPMETTEWVLTDLKSALNPCEPESAEAALGKVIADADARAGEPDFKPKPESEPEPRTGAAVGMYAIHDECKDCLSPCKGSVANHAWGCPLREYAQGNVCLECRYYTKAGVCERRGIERCAGDSCWLFDDEHAPGFDGDVSVTGGSVNVVHDASDDGVKMRLVSVFDSNDLPQELYEYACEEQANDSYVRVRLPYGTNSDKWDSSIPWDNKIKLAQWCMNQGAKSDGRYPYCLIFVSW